MSPVPLILSAVLLGSRRSKGQNSHGIKRLHVRRMRHFHRALCPSSINLISSARVQSRQVPNDGLTRIDVEFVICAPFTVAVVTRQTEKLYGSGGMRLTILRPTQITPQLRMLRD
ncbi:hypothetical protein ACLOJK_024663 [Asimina triloba]